MQKLTRTLKPHPLQTQRYLLDAIDKWIKGDEPFTARLNPDLGGYNDYDQLMRLDEWQARGEAEG